MPSESKRSLSMFQRERNKGSGILLPYILLLFFSPLAQSQNVGEPRFEAASIRSAPDCSPQRPGFPPGRLNLQCVTVRNLIQVSYGTYGAVRNPRIQIVDGPAWYAAEKYDVSAKAENTGASAEQMMGPMLRALLEDRFGLKTHMEKRELPVYALTVAKGGLKIQPAKAGSCGLAPAAPIQPAMRPCGSSANRVNDSIRTIDTWGANVADFLHSVIAQYLDRPVIDKTGLVGLYDYHLDFSDSSQSGTTCSGECPNPADSLGQSVFTAFQNQLGLKLTASSGPVEVLVIDHIDRPSEN